jgi:glutathione S-transferase
MALTLYHAEPVANSLKCLAALHEKGLPFTSRYVDLHRFEQHEPWFVALNPDGQVPVLDHDGVIITQTTVINEYLDDAFAEGAQLRPADALGKARVRAWNKFIDEHVMNHVSMHGWHRMVGVIARSIQGEEFEKLMERIPLKEQRDKWRTARSGFNQQDLDEAERKITVAVARVEAQLAKSPWIAGDTFSSADINFFSHCGMMVARMFPHLGTVANCPRLLDWVERVKARPGMAAALKAEDRTDPRLRTFTGHAK